MQIRKRGLSSAEREDLWQRWRKGQSLHEIGRVLGKAPGSVHFHLAVTGGISPAPRHRNERALSASDREEISRALCCGTSMRSIARQLGRPPSTVTREVARNGGRARYRAADADAQATRNALRPKRCKLAGNRELRMVVASKLRQEWSPEQIAGWLKLQNPDEDRMQISHETIYRSLYIQARGVLKKELQYHLRTQRKFRRAKNATNAAPKGSRIADTVSISERPASVEDRAVPGHWEGDLISGARNSHIATLVERTSRFTMLVKVNGKAAENVAAALIRQVSKLPAELRRSLTWDRGGEMGQHKAFTVATDVKVYFCDPRSPWQRGTNENTNGLLRQYFPDGTELSQFSQAHLNKVARRLNERPRKTLAFRTPADTLAAALR